MDRVKIDRFTALKRMQEKRGFAPVANEFGAQVIK